MKLESTIDAKRGFLHFAALVDALLILMVFFVLSSDFIVNSGIPVELPRVDSLYAETVVDAHILRVSAGPQPRIFLNGRSIGAGQLVDSLSSENKRAVRKSVVIQADVLTTHGLVLELSNIVLGEGYELVLGTLPE